MKARLTILVLILSLALAACSLAEDITPPANYSTPSSISVTLQATQTPIPPATKTSAPTLEPATATAETSPATAGSNTPVATDSNTPAATDSTTPAAEISPTAQPSMVVIDGTVTVASGAVIPTGTVATLLVYDTTAGQVTQTLTAPILAGGNYEFSNVPATTTTVYLTSVDYGDVTYDSVPAQFDGTVFQFNMPITVYDSTTDLSVLTITQAHLQFDFSTASQVQVMVLYVITNPGGSTVVVTSDGTSVPFIQIPESATNVKYQLAQSSSPLMSAKSGFALLPGANLQYGIIATFTLPYTKSLAFTQPFNLPVSSATIIVPEGVKVKSDQLTDAGTQASTGTTVATYHLYQASSLASGSTLSMTISGMPGDKPGFVLNTNTLLMIGVGAVGLILIILGIFLFLRDRKLRKMEDEFEDDEEEGEKDAIGEDRDSIMDAVIALDDQYKTGDISKEAYEMRRDELIERLKNLP